MSETLLAFTLCPLSLIISPLTTEKKPGTIFFTLCYLVFIHIDNIPPRLQFSHQIRLQFFLCLFISVTVQLQCGPSRTKNILYLVFTAHGALKLSQIEMESTVPQWINFINSFKTSYRHLPHILFKFACSCWRLINYF